MTRVSLKEAYDNKDVVAQIYAIRDIAEGAEDTADSAVTTANTASAHVDELVPQVEGAVQNANNASASAQASAQTVAGYENRLSAVEGETAGLDSDLNAVTLRVTTAEGQIVTIQGRVTALETADGQNVKINRINEYAVGLTGNQTNIGGIKGFKDGIVALPQGWHSTNKSGMTVGQYCIFAKIAGGYSGRYEAIDFFQSSNTASVYGRLIIRANQTTPLALWAVRKSNGGNNPLSATSIAVISDGTDLFLAWKKEAPYGAVSARLAIDMSYGSFQSTSNITWYNESEMTVLNDLSGYTVFEVAE